ncbi:hypothetical protein [uncultured Tateyamaria sp.]|uniref:hypothetical protein n=1 Tax=uncultured Tateyamaria sp. TaxID=455651 RepID=UPI002610CB93|nr:hypothetical protein [uncultured Tateyamaria sp.]
MKAQLKTLLTSFLLLIAMCVGAFASVSEKHALGDFGSTQQYVGQNPEANQLASLESFGFFQKHASECCNATNTAVKKFPNGTFSVSDWKGYPKGEAIPQPPKNTTFRLIEGDEYAAALKAKNAANRKYRRENNIPNGYEVHEIVPVKYGGSPTDPANKYVLSADYHRKVVSPWWAKLKGSLE